MPELIRCPFCSQTLRVPDARMGKAVKCAKCMTKFTAESQEQADSTGVAAGPTPAPHSNPPTEEPEEDDDDRSAEDEDRPRRGRKRSIRRKRSPADPESLVTYPAIGLMIVGGLDALTAIVDLGPEVLGFRMIALGPAGQPGPPPLLTLASALAIAAFVFIGGLRMKEMANYSMVFAAAIVAMAPCSFCCTLGIPVGIWSLVVLCRSDVRAAFV